MNKDSDWIVIGRFGRPHGIKGLISVHSFTEPRDNILNYKAWHTKIRGVWQPLKITHLEATEKSLLAQVEGFNEREQVAALTNAEIGASSDQLPTLQPGEYYWHQLCGMKVVNVQGAILGSVVEMVATGSNDVFVVRGEKRYLIPYLPGQFVLNINEAEQIITVDWDVDF